MSLCRLGHHIHSQPLLHVGFLSLQHSVKLKIVLTPPLWWKLKLTIVWPLCSCISYISCQNRSETLPQCPQSRDDHFFLSPPRPLLIILCPSSVCTNILFNLVRNEQVQQISEQICSESCRGRQRTKPEWSIKHSSTVRQSPDQCWVC